MKRILLFILLFAVSGLVKSQCTFDINVLSTTNVTCNGLCNGAISVDATGGTGPYTYVWDDPSSQTTATAVGLCAGTYVVTVVDVGAACTEQLSVQVTEPSILNGAAAGIPTLCSGSADGTIIFTAGGGTMPYQYSIDGGATYWPMSVINGVVAGTYPYVIMDANGCMVNGVVTVTSAPPISTNANVQPSICMSNSGSVQIVTVGGTAPYTYLVQPGNLVGSSGFFGGLAPGVYTYTVTDANGCAMGGVFTIFNVNSMINIATTFSNPTCGVCDGMIAASASGGSGAYIYNWSNGNTTQTITNLCSGVYTVTATDANGCVGSDTVVLNSTSTLFNNPLVQNTDCGACTGSVAAFVTGGQAPYEYSFDGGLTFSTVDNVSGLCAGPVVVVVEDANNCSNIVTVVVNTDPIPGLTVTDSIQNESGTGLEDGFIDLTLTGSTGPYTFLWSNGATTEDIYSISGGNYSVTITDNNGACTVYNFTVGTIPAYGYVSGVIYNDINTNCMYDAGDVALANYYVTLFDGISYYYALTNSQGEYSAWVPTGNYSVVPYSSANLSLTCTTSYNVAVTNGSSNGNNNFAYNFPSVYDVCVNVWSSGIVPGFNGTYSVYLSNNGTMPADGEVCLALPGPLTFVSSNPSGTFANDTICISYTALAPGTTAYYNITFNTPASLALGTPMIACINATVTNGVDINPACNQFCYTRIVTGSFDPNDKTVSPAGENATGDIEVDEDEFTYLIRFQNTGTGPAVNIVITDTLSALLDMQSIEVLNASHNYMVELLPNNIVRWKFNNIMLPDSGSNEPGSHGHVQFRINTLNTPIVGQEIFNTANIYFDFNEPIITNTTVNTYVTPDGITEMSEENRVNIYPNPSEGIVAIVFKNQQSEISLVEVMDLAGRIVLSTSMQSQKSIDLSAYGKGAYWIRISNENGVQTLPIIIR